MKGATFGCIFHHTGSEVLVTSISSTVGTQCKNNITILYITCTTQHGTEFIYKIIHSKYP